MSTPTHVQIARARVPRRWLLLYDVVVFAGLIALAILYFRTGAIGHLLPMQLRGLPAYTAWFGTLGSVAISMKGINDHGPEESWGGRWPLWFLSRPFTGLLVGIITYVLLRAVYPSGNPSVPTFEAAAFILGTQENRFFAFLSEVGRLVVNVPDNNSAPPGGAPTPPPTPPAPPVAPTLPPTGGPRTHSLNRHHPSHRQVAATTTHLGLTIRRSAVNRLASGSSCSRFSPTGWGAPPWI